MIAGGRIPATALGGCCTAGAAGAAGVGLKEAIAVGGAARRTPEPGLKPHETLATGADGMLGAACAGGAGGAAPTPIAGGGGCDGVPWPLP